MRIIFVGENNKSGKKPLDSSTRSGELIDRIESELQCKIERTNLFNVDYLPKEKKEKETLLNEWFWTNLPTNEDIIVLLGGRVKREFKYKLENVIELIHPGFILRPWCKIDVNDYVLGAVEKIKKLTTDENLGKV